MNKRRFILLATVCALGALGLAPSAFAEATRTWVSGVGDDANPCSRTAPCKTFAGAISKTAAGGEIDALDPGGFGTVTITKSITLDGRGTHASILAAGTSGININDSGANTIRVKIKNLAINGVNGTTAPGTSGIRFLSGKSLVLDNVDVFDFNANGLTVGSKGKVTVRRSSFDGNLNAGIAVAPGPSGIARVSVVDTELDEGGSGLLAIGSNAKVSIRGGEASANATAGLNANGGTINATGVLVEGNTNAAGTGDGLLSQGGGILRASDLTVTENDLGLSFITGGQLLSRGNNTVEDNTVDGGFSGNYGPR